MARSVNQRLIADAILNGITDAHRFYENCSGGNWLWTGPEYLMSVHIAKSLEALEGPKYVTLETNVHQTLKDAGAIARGAPNRRLRHKGRFDIVLWWGSGLPRAAVEVKNQVYSFAQIASDVERIEAVVKRNKEQSTFQFGAVTFYTSCVDDKRRKLSAKDILEKRLGRLHLQAKEHVSKNMLVTLRNGDIVTEDDSAWAPSCLIFKTAADQA